MRAGVCCFNFGVRGTCYGFTFSEFLSRLLVCFSARKTIESLDEDASDHDNR